jgi:hypothetical protein
LFEKKGASLRHTGVYTAMVNLHGLLHVADDKPFVMGETAIFNWLKRRWATQKAAGINSALAAAVSAATAAEEEDTDDDDDDDVDVGHGVQVNYWSMLIAPLRDLLRSRRLSDSGKKAELMKRSRALKTKRAIPRIEKVWPYLQGRARCQRQNQPGTIGQGPEYE